MRVAFAGSPSAAVPVLRALAASPHEVALVISQPDRPRGRAGAPSPTPVAEAAEDLGLPTLRPESINEPEALDALRAADARALCVAAYGRILREPILSEWVCLNVHYSLLPAYRGASPVERALMDGVARTGVTIMRMDAGLDTGPIVAMREVEVDPEEDAGAVIARLAVIGGELLVAALDALEAGRLELREQPQEGVSLAPKLGEEDRMLDFGRPATDLANQVRALSPHLGAYCYIDGQRFKVWRAQARPDAGPDGLSVDGDRLIVGCGDGTLEILEVQPPNRSRMPAGAFLRGWRGALESDPAASTPERVVALAVLRRVEGGAYADRALAGEAARAGLDPRARARAHRLAFGAVQRRRTLDWLIDGAMERPRALEPAVRDVMRIGAYELMWSDGTPARAAVDQAVRLARGLAGGPDRARARAGVVNAVLRRLAREGSGRLAVLRDEDPAGAALAHSVPDWIAARLFAALGPDDARGVLRAANRAPESALRWNPLRGPRATVERELPPGWRRDPLIPEAYVLAGPFALEESHAWATGRAVGQSRASQLCSRLVDPRAGERVLDLCAAPGAKATHLAALSRNGAEVVAVELRPARAEALRALARRLGARIEVVVGDGRDVPLPAGFDAALVDPPCSGLGVLAARPDARWRRREEDVGPLAALQRDLLARAADRVRPGGRIVYSTCTLLPEENDEVVAAIGLPLDDAAAELPALAHPRLPGALLTLPHRHDTDGFFVARLRR